MKNFDDCFETIFLEINQKKNSFLKQKGLILINKNSINYFWNEETKELYIENDIVNNPKHQFHHNHFKLILGKKYKTFLNELL